MAERAGPETALIRFPREAVDEIIELLDHGEHILAVVNRSKGLPPAASITGFSSRVARELALDAALVANIVTTLWQLKNLQQDARLETAAFVATLKRSLESRPVLGAKNEQQRQKWEDKWKNVAPVLSAALDAIDDDHPLLTSAKATLLAYSQQNLFLSAQVLTDVRPVFNAAGDKIVETVITHTLLVRYRADNEPRLITFALDQQDLVTLRKQCERAERKSTVAKNSLKDLNPVVLPEENPS
jgi:hypothetical protein